MSIFKAFLLTLLFCVCAGLTYMWPLLLEVLFGIIIGYQVQILVSEIVVTTLVVILIRKQYGTKGLVPKKTSIHFYTVASLLGVLYVFIQTPLNIPYNLVFDDDYIIQYSFDLSQLLGLRALRLLLFVPVSEELFFRHFIQRKLQATYKPYMAILVSTLLFASIHLPFVALINSSFQWDVHHAYIAFFGGLMSALLYYKSKSIGPSILFHIMWNMGVTIF